LRSGTARIPLDLCAAFFAFKGAMRALKDFLNSQHLAPSNDGRLFLFRKVLFVFK
jgi:hypothetical protein